MDTARSSVSDWKSKLGYMLFGLFCAMVGGMVLSPVTANRDKFGDIECTSLTVTHPVAGKATIELTLNGLGGEINITDFKGNRQIHLLGTGIANGLYIHGYLGKPVVSMISDAAGGLVTVADNSGKSTAGIANSKNGGGILEIYDKTGVSAVILNVTKHGGTATFNNSTHNPSVFITSGFTNGDSGAVVILNGAKEPIASLP